MNKFNIYAYSIECLTNLHVGSGGDNFGIVDKEIQRDQVDNVPIIHASSLKGAIREFFEQAIGAAPDLLKKYFGSDKNEQENLQQGALRFFEARLFAIPIRGTGNVSDYLGTSKKLLGDYNSLAKKMDTAMNGIGLPTINNENAITEFGNTTLVEQINSVGPNIAYLSDEMMKKALTDLPIIARNSLENGQSENLWYEEVIPRGSKFCFFIAVPNDETEYKSEFEDALIRDIIQIGANATIGYGFCKISKLN